MGQKKRLDVSSVQTASRADDAPEQSGTDAGIQKKPRAPQTCRVCGQQRRGHTCPGAWVGAARIGEGSAASSGQAGGKEAAGGQTQAPPPAPGPGKGKGKGKGKEPKGESRLAQLQTMLAERQQGLKAEQAKFTREWVQAMVRTGDGQDDAPSLERLTAASDEHLLNHMEQHDDPWLKRWQDTFEGIIMKPGDDEALSALQSELEHADTEHDISEDGADKGGLAGEAAPA